MSLLSMRRPRLPLVARIAALALAAACGGSDDVSGNIVPDDRVASVRVEPSSITLGRGAQQSLTATAYNASSAVVSGRTFVWSTSAPTTAAVDASGTVTAVATGTATISAETGGISGTATVSVTAPPAADSVVANVAVTPSTASLLVGGTIPLGAAATNAAGQPLTKTFAWSSSAPAFASVSATGVVTGVAIGGPVTITASVDGKSASASVMVTPPSTSTGTITVNSAQQFQTMTGWEALNGTGYGECDRTAYQIYMPELISRMANELKINRLRVPLRGGYEQTYDSFLQFQSGQLTWNQWSQVQFVPANDNADPFVINPAGFQWGHLDWSIEQTVLPMKRALQAIGDDLWFSLGYTGNQPPQNLYRDNPEEYAELVLAAFQHLQQKYGLLPNTYEIVNEPNLGVWTAQHVGANLLAVKRRLNQAGFFPEFIGPTASGAFGTIEYFDIIMRMPGAAQALSEITYHRYGGMQPSFLQGLAQRGQQYGMRTAMTEHIFSGYVELHDDLTIANVSAWQQFSMAFCVASTNNGSGGGLYFVIHNAMPGQTNPTVVTAKTSTYLRQYFRYVRLGAVRLGATTANAAFSPVAFRNKDGRYSVVVKATSGGSFTVGGLPAGTYGIEYTTASEYAKSLADVTITASQAVSASIPAAGALTVYAK